MAQKSGSMIGKKKVPQKWSQKRSFSLWFGCLGLWNDHQMLSLCWCIRFWHANFSPKSSKEIVTVAGGSQKYRSFGKYLIVKPNKGMGVGQIITHKNWNKENTSKQPCASHYTWIRHTSARKAVQKKESQFLPFKVQSCRCLNRKLWKEKEMRKV